MGRQKHIWFAAGLSLIPVLGIVSYGLLGRRNLAWMSAALWAVLGLTMAELTANCESMICLLYFGIIVLAVAILWASMVIHILYVSINDLNKEVDRPRFSTVVTVAMTVGGIVVIISGLIWVLDSQSNIENREQQLERSEQRVLDIENDPDYTDRSSWRNLQSAKSSVETQNRYLSEYVRDRNIAAGISALGVIMMTVTIFVVFKKTRGENVGSLD